ncbi:hypothetical protein KSP39_PZI003737 [Platanthera zijinensis]|uniref:Uncharacterized protein n=1 Tax=Platanthera zijinensis TaxID=2320716 RepID=A0AAP0BVJ3_9ASPA
MAEREKRRSGWRRAPLGRSTRERKREELGGLLQVVDYGGGGGGAAGGGPGRDEERGGRACVSRRRERSGRMAVVPSLEEEPKIPR